MPVPADAKLIVRRVLPVDLRASAELLVETLRARGRAPDVDALRNAVEAALQDQSRVLVAGAYHEGQPGFAHGKMVGVLLMNVVTSVADAGEAGWIETLYVKPDYRRRRLAEQLLALAHQWAGTRGLRRLDLEIAEGHDAEAAESLYRKHGFSLVQRARMTRDLTK